MTTANEQKQSSDPSCGSSRLNFLHRWLFPDQPISPTSVKSLPSLPQKHFVHLWKTLHDIFIEQPAQSAFVNTDIQKLYHSVSLVGTQLLQIGEVGQKMRDDNPSDWSITFNQFLATFLNESALVDYFERKIDLREGLDKMNASKLLKRQDSSAAVASRSVFYV